MWQTYDTVSKKSVEDDSSYEGMCEENMSKLSIRWNNDTFTLNLTFVIQVGTPSPGLFFCHQCK